MLDDIERLTVNVTRRGAVDEHELTRAGNTLGIPWPDDYRSYMLETGGGEGWVGGGYLALWPVEELVEINGPTVQEFEPELVGIGTDGAGELFAYDTSQGTPQLVMTPLVDLARSSWIAIGSFHELLVRLAEDRLFDSRDIARH